MSTSRRGFLGRLFGGAVAAIVGPKAKLSVVEPATWSPVQSLRDSLPAQFHHPYPQNIGQIIESGNFPTMLPRANFRIVDLQDPQLVDRVDDVEAAHILALIEAEERRWHETNRILDEAAEVPPELWNIYPVDPEGDDK